MKYPDPAPGLVIRYAFLWSSEHEKAIYEAVKDRPCAIVLAAKIKDTSLVQTVVVPITHSKPSDGDPTASMEIPREICKKLGLDGEKHWVRLTELIGLSGRDMIFVNGRMHPTVLTTDFCPKLFSSR